MPTVPSNPQSLRRLIVNADDFGRSRSINAAVIRAHREGVLTSASLMVNEPGCAEAVALARQNPNLGVGLHLTLVCGKSALPPEKIPGLVGRHGQFSDRPVTVGMRYFFDRDLQAQLRAEIHAQFAEFRATGLPLDHVNGHLHLHLHPAIFRILMEDAASLGIRHLRLTREPFWMDMPLAKGNHLHRSKDAAIFFLLSWRAQRALRRMKIRHTQRVFGLLQTARVSEPYLLKLLAILPRGDSELYSHPSIDESRHELDALISPRVKERIEQLGIKLIRYQDL